MSDQFSESSCSVELPQRYVQQVQGCPAVERNAKCTVPAIRCKPTGDVSGWVLGRRRTRFRTKGFVGCRANAQRPSRGTWKYVRMRSNRHVFQYKAPPGNLQFHANGRII